MKKCKILFLALSFLVSFSCFAGEFSRTVYEGEEWIKNNILPALPKLSSIHISSFGCNYDKFEEETIKSFVPDSFLENCLFKDIYFSDEKKDEYFYKITFFCEKDEHKDKNLQVTFFKRNDNLCIKNIGYGYNIMVSDE